MPVDESLPPLSVISWSSDVAEWDSALLRYGTVGLLGGMALIAVTLLLVVAVDAARSGNYGVVAFLVLALLFGGPASVITIGAAVSSGKLSRLVPGIETFRPRWVLLSSFVGIGVILVVASYPPLFFALLALGIGLALVKSIRHASGTLDVEAKTLTVPRSGDLTHEYDLDGLRSFAVHRVADTVVFRLRFVGTRGLSGPSFVSAPAEHATEIHTALHAITDQTEANAGVSKAAATVLGIFGVGFLFLASTPWVLLQLGELSPASSGFVVYLSLFLSWFGVLFIVIAVRSRR